MLAKEMILKIAHNEGMMFRTPQFMTNPLQMADASEAVSLQHSILTM
jgi:hypothetical protein